MEYVTTMTYFCSQTHKCDVPVYTKSFFRYSFSWEECYIWVPNPSQPKAMATAPHHQKTKKQNKTKHYCMSMCANRKFIEKLDTIWRATPIKRNQELKTLMHQLLWQNNPERKYHYHCNTVFLIHILWTKFFTHFRG